MTNTTKMFLAQIESDQTIQYGVVAITDSGLTFRIPSSPQQENKQESPLTIALRSAGVKFFIEESWGSSYYRFDDPEQLLAAGRVLAGDVKFAAAVAIYRLVDSAKPDEVARLKTELAQTQANAGTKSEPQNAQTKKTEPEAVFTNYSHPRLFDAIYRGDADSRAITDLDVVFLQEFLQNFLKSNNCNHLVSDATFIQISTKAEIAAFRNQTSDFFRTQKQHRPTTGPIDYSGLVREGMEAALGPLAAASREIINAQKDGLLFVTQYGCDGPVPNRFFENMGIFVRRL